MTNTSTSPEIIRLFSQLLKQLVKSGRSESEIKDYLSIFNKELTHTAWRLMLQSANDQQRDRLNSTDDEELSSAIHDIIASNEKNKVFSAQLNTLLCDVLTDLIQDLKENTDL